jgi:hypothetical protein
VTLQCVSLQHGLAEFRAASKHDIGVLEDIAFPQPPQ